MHRKKFDQRKPKDGTWERESDGEYKIDNRRHKNSICILQSQQVFLEISSFSMANLELKSLALKAVGKGSGLCICDISVLFACFPW